ncbi:putative transcription factor bZIP family [Helianthus anomalus]
MGFTGHINGKIIKTMLCHAYKFMIHCVVHALSHRKGAYDETSDYIMNIITCLVLNRPYNVSKVIFEYLKENIRAGSTKYIMYLRFIQMMIDDQFKGVQKDNGDILGLRHMTYETFVRLTKGTEERAKRMICRINNPAYIAPENDRWRHENSSSDDEDEKMSQLVEKKTRWWFVRDGKRKRTPKTSPAVPIPKEPVPKIVVKGPSKQPQQRLVDEQVLDHSSIPQEGIDLEEVTFEHFIQLNEAATQKVQSSSVQAENEEPKGVVHDDSSEDADSESTETETELDLTTLGRGKAQLKKKPSKKQKTYDEEDSAYVPPEKSKKLRAKRKAVQYGVLLRKVRARKCAEKAQSVETPKAPEVQSQSVPEAEIQKKTGGDDYVEITGYKVVTPPSPPPQDQPIPEDPKSSQPNNTSFVDLFGELPHATGVYRDYIPEEDYDMFNNEAVKELMKRVVDLEKEKDKAVAERDVLKKQVEELMKANDEIKSVMIKQQEKLKKKKDGNHDNSQLFEILSAENVEMREKMKNLQDVNQTLNQLLSEINEASSNEMKAMKLEMEAMKADEVMKDEQLYMLYSVIESHINNDIHVTFNNIEVKRAEERRVERERRLAEEATQKNKSVIEEIQEVGGSSRQVDDDDDQGTTGLLIVNPNDDDHQEASTFGNQHADQVYLSQPTVIYLNAHYEGEIEVPRSRAEMLEELGLDDGKFKFDIEDEIPAFPEKEYEFLYAKEADKYNDVIVEDASDSSDEETDFHHSGVDETFPSFAEMFKDRNEDEIRRMIVEKVSTEGVPKTIP